jgi:hypothetical protein
MIDFDELRGLADETRAYIQMSDDKAFALRAIVISHDVVLGIYPSAEGMGLHVIKGDELLRQIANSNQVGDYTHAAIAVRDQEQAKILKALVA